jgi:type IV secretion system protein VirB9
MSLFMLLGPLVAHAELVARPGRFDPRIRSLPYSAEQVFLVTGTYGLVTTILFGADEDITQVVAGDTVSWQILTSADRRSLTLKPMEKDAATNLSVVTTKQGDAEPDFQAAVHLSGGRGPQRHGGALETG